mmetsp:Transcript_24360/g.57736  ORF Transcript_24360/g.57736 Transcript_24360/m.57736 type:complete len:223 (-) Transcript_24360:130-798(-)
MAPPGREATPSVIGRRGIDCNNSFSSFGLLHGDIQYGASLYTQYCFLLPKRPKAWPMRTFQARGEQFRPCHQLIHVVKPNNGTAKLITFRLSCLARSSTDLSSGSSVCLFIGFADPGIAPSNKRSLTAAFGIYLGQRSSSAATAATAATSDIASPASLFASLRSLGLGRLGSLGRVFPCHLFLRKLLVQLRPQPLPPFHLAAGQDHQLGIQHLQVQHLLHAT